ncbi:MAG: phenylalanine--tRNA ligase subunit beta [Planctomycetota bacterium]
MKLTMSWLREHLETNASVSEIAAALTHIGLEVESVTDPGSALVGFTVAEVLRAERHPNADKLQVCEVDTGSARVQVVCGAPNARARLKVAFAPPGTTIPATGVVLKAAQIRGVESCGMLCSGRELGLSEEHAGIIELAPDARVGGPIAEALGLDDPVIEISITPNRPDCLGVFGVARDLAARGIGILVALKDTSNAARSGARVSIGLRFEEPTRGACPLFAGRVIEGVRNGPSAAWLERRLRAIGLRPRSALVDITNYVSYDRARPLHVYDAAHVHGELHARLGRAGEKLLALDGKEYLVDEQMCVIADERGVLGLGGVMGGSASGATDATTSVIIESALFDPIRTGATGRRLGIESDARYRFERGVDPEGVLTGLEYATRLVLEMCGGAAGPITIAGRAPSWRRSIDFDTTQVARLTGMQLGDARIREILAALGFACVAGDGKWLVTPPSWRPDVHGPADLVEEVTRIHGLEHLPTQPLPKTSAPTGVAAMLSLKQKRVRWAKRLLAARGLCEAVTWSFTSRAHAELFGGGQAALELANPISVELAVMRPSILPNLIAAASRNMARGLGDFGLFEVGPQYRGDAPEDQSTAVTGIRCGQSGPRHWGAPRRAVDVYDAKADALAVIAECGVATDRLQVTTDAPAWYHPGRSGVLRLGPGAPLAVFGELHPRILKALDARGPISGFEVTLDALAEPKARSTRTKAALNASDLQPLERDFAFVVATDVTAEQLLRAVRGVDRQLITDASVFDVFASASLGADRKSVAVSVTLEPREKTLTDAEIEALGARIVAAVVKATGATLRA